MQFSLKKENIDKKIKIKKIRDNISVLISVLGKKYVCFESNNGRVDCWFRFISHSVYTQSILTKQK